MSWIKSMFKANVDVEQQRQVELWGVQNHEDWKWFIILVEEIGEVAKAILEGRRNDILNELVQCVAVIHSWIECLDRRWEDESKIKKNGN